MSAWALRNLVGAASPAPLASPVKAKVVRALETFSRVAGILVLAVAAVALVGWAFDVAVLVASVKLDAALGFVLAGVALSLPRADANDDRGRRLARALAGLIFALGMFTLLEYATGWNLAGGTRPGRLSLAAAFGFSVMGAALALGSSSTRYRFADWLALGGSVASLLALLGYWYGEWRLYGGALLSLPTSAAFFLSSMAMLAARPERGLMRFVAATGPGGMLARRMLPASILVPATLGWLRLEGQRMGLYQTEFGLALFAAANVVCFAVVTWWTARAVFRSDAARLQAEADLREREDDLVTTLNSIGDAVIATDAEGVVTRLNPVAEKLTGWPCSEAVGRKLEQVFQIESESSKPARMLSGGRVVGLVDHGVLTSRDEVERPIANSAAPIRDASGRLRGMVLVFRDMTKERKAERALRESQALFTRISDSGIVGIVVLDLSGEIKRANDAFLDMIGYSRDDLSSGELRAVELTPAELLASGISGPRERELVRKDGSRVPVLTAVARLDARSVVNVVADLSELKRAERDHARLDAKAIAESAGRERAEVALRETEEQLRQAQKMEALGTLAGGVAHDFNNLLSVVLSYSQLLLSDLRRGDPMREEIEEIQKAGERAAALTAQLLMFTRHQVVEPRVMDLNEVLAGIASMLRRIVGEDVELLACPATSLRQVRVDPGSIEQLIVNLVVNARDAMPRGGKLTIDTANVILDEAYAQKHFGVKPGPHVMLAVSDTGTGMDPVTRARIFEPFFTTKEKGKGTGLGLSTVFGIVQQSEGSVWVYSEVGKGTTIKVYFPVTDGEVVGWQSRQAPVTLRGSETILLVEDEEQVRVVASGILERQGYRVIPARSASEAMISCAAHAGVIDLLLSDVVMPHMSGPELARRLASERPSMKLLCMSGYTDDTVVRHGALEAGIAFIQKPFTPDTLASKVRAVLDSGAAPTLLQ